MTHSNLVRPHYPALDGIRGFAVLAVFADHFLGHILGWDIFLPGWIGVEIFFVLSGFLISSSLYDTLGSPHFFSFFYLKRTLRIFPLYYALWAALLLLCKITGVFWSPRYWLWLAYLGNLRLPTAQSIHGLFDIAFLHLRARPIAIEINHFWSLCVEEQFYLAWPALIALLSSRKRILLSCFAGICLCLAARTVLLPLLVHTEFAYHATYLRLDGLLVGTFLAVWIRERCLPVATARTIAALLFLGALIPLVIYTLREILRAAPTHHLPARDLGSPFISTVGFTLIALCAGALLLACLDPPPLLRAIFTSRSLAFFGRISYGFYLFHDLPQAIFDQYASALRARHLLLPSVLGWFLLCTALATLSFRFFETPLLNLKKRLTHRQPAAQAS